jgi:hypothetical protein
VRVERRPGGKIGGGAKSVELTDDGDDYRGLGWAHGALTVQRLGAMMAPVTFLLADGRQVSPLHVASWAREPNTQNLPGVLRRLRGEWPCAPFGYSVESEGWPADWAATMGPAEPDEEVHGYCSNHDWQWQEAPGNSLRLSIDYPAASPIQRVERSVTPDPHAAAVDLEFRIIARRRCRMPIGLHPVFRLPRLARAARLELGRFDCARTYPGTVEPSAPMFAMNQIFLDLSAAPGRGGQIIDASRLPFAIDTEELLQIEGLNGSVALANHAEGYRARLTWQTGAFSEPSAVDFQPRPQIRAVERAPSGARHRTDLLALRPWSRDGDRRQSDCQIRCGDRSRIFAR